jgi:hypothetical protein
MLTDRTIKQISNCLNSQHYIPFLRKLIRERIHTIFTPGIIFIAQVMFHNINSAYLLALTTVDYRNPYFQK